MFTAVCEFSGHLTAFSCSSLSFSASLASGYSYLFFSFQNRAPQNHSTTVPTLRHTLVSYLPIYPARNLVISAPKTFIFYIIKKSDQNPWKEKVLCFLYFPLNNTFPVYCTAHQFLPTCPNSPHSFSYVISPFASLSHCIKFFIVQIAFDFTLAGLFPPKFYLFSNPHSGCYLIPDPVFLPLLCCFNAFLIIVQMFACYVSPSISIIVF